MSESGGGFNIIAYVSAGGVLRVRALRRVSRTVPAGFDGGACSFSLL